MKKLLRWLGFHVHEWGPWEIIEGNVILISQSGKREACRQTLQRRVCKTCGYSQTANLYYGGSTW